ncbi:MAG: methyltransferase domain-containing protein [Flavobacteriaceae bacterium]|nr:methyltransferase domain-containing protein [Flavobacteriaceae bacterium]MDG2314874.1 methyltransferase domain-containing protein [Flavobacteriaceae bacterium]
MRLHRNLVFAVIDGLDQIFNEDFLAHKAVEKLLKRDKRWGSHDRGFIAETVYEMVRWKRLYMEIAEVKTTQSKASLWRMFAVWATLRGIHLPDWKQLEDTPIRRIKGRFETLSKIRKIKESIPDWLDDLGVEELGEKKWSKELAALNETAQVIIRVNTLKTTLTQLQEALLEENIETSTDSKYPNALVLTKRANVFGTQMFKEGHFELQDASSQTIAPFLEVKPGMRVVDACAGAGGKALHLAALMENKGQIIAMDIYQNKLYELKRRAKRNGAHNIETRWIENSKAIKKLHGKIDRLLIDAPCSGLGVLKRNPDAKWKLQPEFLATIQKTQANILERYAKMVAPQGKMVYATCSILPSENQKQIKRFLETDIGKTFELEAEDTLLPSKTGFDGFYRARLMRN